MIRRLLIFLVFAAALGFGGLEAWERAAETVKARIALALGPRGEAREIRFGPGWVEIFDLRIRAPEDGSWPDAEELSARRVRISPDLLDLLSARLSIDTLRIEGLHLVALRTREGGTAVLPSLRARPAEPPPPQPPPAAGRETGGGKSGAAKEPLAFGRIVVTGGVLDFYDASVRPAAVKLRVEQIEGVADRRKTRESAGRTSVKIDGVLKGGRGDGRIGVEGTVDPAANEIRLVAKLRRADLGALQPYLLRAGETGVQGGLLDLDIKAAVTGRQLRAPGTLTLSELEITPGPTFMGLPALAASTLLKDRKGRVSMQFVLEGDIGDPRFSLNEQLSERIASALAGVLGISVESLVKSVGRTGETTARAVEKSIGRMLKQRKGKR